MKKIIMIVLLIIFTFTCSADEQVLIRAHDRGKHYEKNIPANVEELTLVAIHSTLDDIKGIEKLKKLKKLTIGPGIKDYSFLEKLPQLETLILNGVWLPNLSVLEYLPNLEVVYLNVAGLTVRELDFSANKKLKFVVLHYFHINPPNQYFDFSLKNLPKTLKYLDITRNSYINMTETFFKEVSQSPVVILDKKVYLQHERFFKEQPNFTFEYGDDFPEEYKEKVLLKKSEYSFF